MAHSLLPGTAPPLPRSSSSPANEERDPESTPSLLSGYFWPLYTPVDSFSEFQTNLHTVNPFDHPERDHTKVDYDNLDDCEVAYPSPQHYISVDIPLLDQDGRWMYRRSSLALTSESSSSSTQSLSLLDHSSTRVHSSDEMHSLTFGPAMQEPSTPSSSPLSYSFPHVGLLADFNSLGHTDDEHENTVYSEYMNRGPGGQFDLGYPLLPSPPLPPFTGAAREPSTGPFAREDAFMIPLPGLVLPIFGSAIEDYRFPTPPRVDTPPFVIDPKFLSNAISQPDPEYVTSPRLRKQDIGLASSSYARVLSPGTLLSGQRIPLAPNSSMVNTTLPPITPAPRAEDDEEAEDYNCNSDDGGDSEYLPPDEETENPRPMTRHVRIKLELAADEADLHLLDCTPSIPLEIDDNDKILNAHVGVPLVQLLQRASAFREQHGPTVDLSRDWLSTFAGRLSPTGAILSDFRCYVAGCTRANKRRDHILTHVGAHIGLRPFKCAICGVGFLRKNECRRHEANHSTERPYPCLVCGARYARQDIATRHVQKTHPRDFAAMREVREREREESAQMRKKKAPKISSGRVSKPRAPRRKKAVKFVDEDWDGDL